MATNNKYRGILFAYGAALALSLSFIFSKMALNELSMIQFGVCWFALGTLWNILYITIAGKTKEILRINKTEFIAILAVALLEAVASGLFYIAIKKVANPAIVAFIGSMGPVFVTILGIVFLKETYSRKEMAGILMAIIGVITISYNGQELNNFLLHGTEYVLAASFLFAIATVVARKHHRKINPPLLALLRAGLLFISFVVLFINSDTLLQVSTISILYMSVGSLLEGLLTMVFAYFALKYIEAARTSLIISSKSIITLVIAWLVWHIFPETRQVAGGLLTMIGLYLLTIQKQKK